VRAATDDRKARDEWMSRICERLDAHAVQQIGKVLVIYRENPAKDTRQEPGKPDRPAARRPPPDTPAATRSGRPRSRTPSPRPASAPRRRRPRSSR
jgi:hypothetical protein